MYENNLVESLLEAAEFYENLDESTSEGRKIGRELASVSLKDDLTDEEEETMEKLREKIYLGIQNANAYNMSRSDLNNIDIEDHLPKLMHQMKRKGTVNFPLNKINPNLSGYATLSARAPKELKEASEYFSSMDESTSEGKNLGRSNAEKAKEYNKLRYDYNYAVESGNWDECNKLYERLKRLQNELDNNNELGHFNAKNVTARVRLGDLVERGDDILEKANDDEIKQMRRKGTANIPMSSLIPGATGYVSASYRQPKVKK